MVEYSTHTDVQVIVRSTAIKAVLFFFFALLRFPWIVFFRVHAQVISLSVIINVMRNKCITYKVNFTTDERGHILSLVQSPIQNLANCSVWRFIANFESAY